MTMTRNLRKLALTTHIALSVGWIGGVGAYLVLVVAAITSPDIQTLRAAWIAMELIARHLIVPLALASLLTGFVMALATPWGLFRHYWVIVSIALTVVAAAVLLRHIPTVSFFAGMAAAADVADVGRLRGGLRGELLHAGVGLLVLLVIEGLNVFKPAGMTAYGRRKASHAAVRAGSIDAAGVGASRETSAAGMPRWVWAVGIHAVVLVLLFAAMHLAGGLPRH